MAEPHVHVSKACREDAFGVKKGALTATASERVVEMAKPTHSADPVERPPPREKNAYGAPIFPKPVSHYLFKCLLVCYSNYLQVKYREVV